VIPGARSPEQARSNAEAADVPALSEAVQDGIRGIYNEQIRPLVHHRW
jgi:aryl-alcohol dehydrogenase-like predicted oxidoreductase